MLLRRAQSTVRKTGAFSFKYSKSLLTCWVKVTDQGQRRRPSPGLHSPLPARILALTPQGRAGALPGFQTHQQAVHVLGASDQSGEGAQLLRQGQEDLVLIVDGICGTRQTGLQSRPTADSPWGTSVLQSASSTWQPPPTWAGRGGGGQE